MSAVVKDLLAANERYAGSFDKGSLAIPPQRKIAILTCMDARIEPLRMAGLDVGDAHVIRNAGGRASDDAIRSLIISHKLLGTEEWFVVHHTNCGMQLFKDDVMRNLLASSLQTARLDPDGNWSDAGDGPGSHEGDYIDWLAFDDLTASVVSDVNRLRHHPLVSKKVNIHGFIYQVETGRLVEVPVAAA